MAVYTELNDPTLPRGAMLSIGNFDGVHRGHQLLVEALLHQADRARVPAIVMTFDPPPARILAPERCPPLLTTVTAKTQRLQELGVDGVLIYPATRSLLDLSPGEFFEQIVVGQLEARGLVEGLNFCFGKDRAGDVQLLETLCAPRSLCLTVVQPKQIDGLLVSSSEIRKALSEGDVSAAAEMLGRPYSLSGRVIQGAQRGRTLGFPTANLGEIATLIPLDGVYAATCELDGCRRPAAVHIGPNPTFAEELRKVEVHVIDYVGDLYGQPLTIDIIDWVRGTRRFADEAAIIEQIEQDLLLVRALVE